MWQIWPQTLTVGLEPTINYPLKLVKKKSKKIEKPRNALQFWDISLSLDMLAPWHVKNKGPLNAHSEDQTQIKTTNKLKVTKSLSISGGESTFQHSSGFRIVAFGWNDLSNSFRKYLWYPLMDTLHELLHWNISCLKETTDSPSPLQQNLTRFHSPKELELAKKTCECVEPKTWQNDFKIFQVQWSGCN